MMLDSPQQDCPFGEMSCPHAKLTEFLFYVQLKRALDCLPKQLTAHIMKLGELINVGRRRSTFDWTGMG